jgi:hypothetical protein
VTREKRTDLKSAVTLQILIIVTMCKKYHGRFLDPYPDINEQKYKAVTQM